MNSIALFLRNTKHLNFLIFSLGCSKPRRAIFAGQSAALAPKHLAQKREKLSGVFYIINSVIYKSTKLARASLLYGTGKHAR